MKSLLLLAAIIVGLLTAGCHPVRGQMPGTELTGDQEAALNQSIDIMRGRGLMIDAEFAKKLQQLGKWRAATANDPYMAGAEKAGNTPYAYTLSPGKKPVAIVLAGRFFSEATPLGRAALMIHEMGHYRAYVRTGHSDEFDGYKAEYDNYRRLGLSETDGLVYFSMLDGTAEYVVPRNKSYAKNPDLLQFLTN